MIPWLKLTIRWHGSDREAKRARELDPFMLIAGVILGGIFHFARQYDRAIEEYQKTLEMDPNFLPSQLWLSYPYALKGMYKEAIAEVQKAIELSGGHPPAIVGILGLMYAFSGKRDKAKKILKEMQELSKQWYFSPIGFALIYMIFGERDQGFEWLEKAYKERDHWMAGLKEDPLFDIFRSDPRYIVMLKKMNFD